MTQRASPFFLFGPKYFGEREGLAPRFRALHIRNGAK